MSKRHIFILFAAIFFDYFLWRSVTFIFADYDNASESGGKMPGGDCEGQHPEISRHHSLFYPSV
jgi:hypothetical protein